MTVDALLRVLPHAIELPGCPEPPCPDFQHHTEAFIQTAVGVALT